MRGDMNKGQWILLIFFAALAFVGGDIATGGNPAGRIADAIAFAEGFYVNGSRPQRNNNPGNLTLSLGFPTIGTDGQFVIFATANDGWNALRKQVSLMLSDQSGVYNSAMSILEMAGHYTLTEVNAWAANVATRLGVSPYTRLDQIT